MKPINEMTLSELQESLRWMGDNNNNIPFEYIQKACYDCANRINELTSWIPVSERIPTVQDGDTGDETGCVIVWVEPYKIPRIVNWKTVTDDPKYSHWKHIVPPEDKP
jgi:hypothetical protein